VPLELFPAAILLHHHVGDFIDALVGRKAALALFALAPAADRVRLFAFAAIDNTILGKSTKRTFHLSCILAFSRRAGFGRA
jgi:hypothetical protein